VHATDRVIVLAVHGPTGGVCLWCDAPLYEVLVVIESPTGQPIEVGTITRCPNAHVEA
jgi:hypothetical protein